MRAFLVSQSQSVRLLDYWIIGQLAGFCSQMCVSLSFNLSTPLTANTAVGEYGLNSFRRQETKNGGRVGEGPEAWEPKSVGPKRVEGEGGAGVSQ